MHLALPMVIGLLVAATFVAIAAKRVHLPYNVALVLGGLAISGLQILPGAPLLDPELVFLICLPALLFEGGITADLSAIRANLVPIVVLSTLGMLLAIGGTGSALHLLLSLPWGPAMLLGAVLAVTDTVSILYAFRREPVPQRLAGIVEGESLFNDGTALVAYGAIVVLAGGGDVSGAAVTARMLLSTGGGIALGLALGFLFDFLLRRTGDPLTEIMATTALALGAYATAEALGVSGVIAAVTAGLAIGNTLRVSLSPQSRIAITSFWEYVAFGVNTFLFLSVGLSTSPTSLLDHGGEIAIGVLCVFAGRALAVYLPFALLRLIAPVHAIRVRWQHVLVIGNIKGALSIALALALPADTPHRALLVDVAFGVTFVSLVGQVGLLSAALRFLGLVRKDPIEEELGEQQGRLIAARAARQELDVLQAAGLVPLAGYDVLRGSYQVSIAGAERQLRALHERHLPQGARALLATRRRLVDAERTALVLARRTGLIADETATRLLAEVDERLLAIEQVLAGGSPSEEKEKR